MIATPMAFMASISLCLHNNMHATLQETRVDPRTRVITLISSSQVRVTGHSLRLEPTRTDPIRALNDNNSSYCHSAWQFSRIKKNYTKVKFDGIHTCTVLVLRMAHRKRKETKQQPSMLPGPAVSGSCLVSLHILWAILSMSTV